MQCATCQEDRGDTTLCNFCPNDGCRGVTSGQGLCRICLGKRAAEALRVQPLVSRHAVICPSCQETVEGWWQQPASRKVLQVGLCFGMSKVSCGVLAHPGPMSVQELGVAVTRQATGSGQTVDVFCMEDSAAVRHPAVCLLRPSAGPLPEDADSVRCPAGDLPRPHLWGQLRCARALEGRAPQCRLP